MKARKNLSVLLMLIMITSLVLAGCTSNQEVSLSAEQPVDAPEIPVGQESELVELKLSFPNADTSRTGQAYTYFAEALEEESGGSISVMLYPAGSLVGNTEILDSIQQGNVDVGHFVASYISPTISEMVPFEIPGAYPGDKYFELYKETKDILSDIFARYDVKYLAPTNQDTSCFATKDLMIKTPDDVANLKVRASGKWIGEAIEKWGGSPVTIPLGDVPVALERGAVESAYTGWQIVGPFKLYEAGKYVTFTNMQEIFGGLMMSMKTWNKLDSAQQAAVDRAIERFMEFDYDITQNMKEKVITEIEDGGGTTYHLTDEENQMFIDAAAPLLEEAKTISGPDGVALIEAFGRIK